MNGVKELVVKILIASLLFSGLILLSVLMIRQCNTIDEAYSEYKISETVSEGVITDKRLVSYRANAFSENSIDYRLYITSEYTDEDGEMLTISKYFSVPEDTYLLYSVGDYFNSHNFKTGDKEA